MAKVTGLTAERMLEIEAASVVSGAVDLLGRLQLQTHGGQTIDAGSVKGPKGEQGIQGIQGVQGLQGIPGDPATLKATPLAQGVNLNTIITPAVYAQTSSAYATLALNYPAPHAGVLEVLGTGTVNSMVWQRYTQYYGGPVWQRGFYSVTGWSPWVVVYEPTTYGTLGFFSPYSDYGAPFSTAAKLSKKDGKVTWHSGLFKFNVATTLTSGTQYNFATIPSGFSPPDLPVGVTRSSHFPNTQIMFYVRPEGYIALLAYPTTTFGINNFLATPTMVWDHA